MLIENPKLSVCVVTYNQLKYIEQCLQSLIDQEVEFPMEILISDDASSDGTQVILIEFQRRYPGLIKIFLQKENLGADKNYQFIHDQARGEFVAHMDGDDYALPGKLQLQVEFMANQPECNLSWHRMKLKNDAKQVIVDDIFDLSMVPQGGFRRRDIIRLISIGYNSSKMYRRHSIEWSEWDGLDYGHNILNVRDGVALFVPGPPLGVYRVFVGVSSMGFASRILLAESFLMLKKRYPQYLRDISVASLMTFLVNLKNRNPTWPVLFTVWLKCFHPFVFFDLLSNIRLMRLLKMPKGVR